jgi:LPXTG-motif cell wall-anchored protein
MGWSRIVAGFVAVVAAVGIVTTSSGIAVAGNGTGSGGVNVDIYVHGANAPTVMSGLTFELFEFDGTTVGTDVASLCDPDDNPPPPNPVYAETGYECTNVPYGRYVLGLQGVPAGAEVDTYCPTVGADERLPGTSAEFVLDGGTNPVSCRITILIPTLLVDKVVDGGPASAEDFTIEVYDTNGGALVATAIDPADDVCSPYALPENCALVGLSEGNFQLGEVPVPGYLPTNVACLMVPEAGERFPAGIGEFMLDFEYAQLPSVYCEITNKYFEGDVVVNKVVVNDDGGTAKAEDFKAEVFLESDGSVATSAQCLADGSCIDAALPIGEYRVGETGPSGYTASVVCEVTGDPDTPVIGTTPPTFDPPEAITGDAALFELEPFGAVTCVITNNDNLVPTTTTTTTTLAPTTTAGAQLPATGGDSDSLGLIAALGAFMLLMGGTLVVARRRT